MTTMAHQGWQYEAAEADSALLCPAIVGGQFGSKRANPSTA
jgi:hypothetical protein